MNIRSVLRLAIVLAGLIALIVSVGCARTRIVSPVVSIPLANRTSFSYDLFVTLMNNTGYVCGRPILGRVMLEGNILPDRFGNLADNIPPGGQSTVQIDVQQYWSTREEVLFVGYILDSRFQVVPVGYDTRKIDFEGYYRLRTRRYSSLETALVWAPQVRVPQGFDCSLVK